VLPNCADQGQLDDAPPRPHLRYTLSAGCSVFTIPLRGNPAGGYLLHGAPRPASTQSQKSRILAGFAELYALPPGRAIGTPRQQGRPSLNSYQALKCRNDCCRSTSLALVQELDVRTALKWPLRLVECPALFPSLTIGCRCWHPLQHSFQLAIRSRSTPGSGMRQSPLSGNVPVTPEVTALEICRHTVPWVRAGAFTEYPKRWADKISCLASQEVV